MYLLHAFDDTVNVGFICCANDFEILRLMGSSLTVFGVCVCVYQST